MDRFSDILRNAVVVDPRAAWTSRSLVRRMNEDVSHVSSVVDGSVLGAVDASSRLVYDQMIDHAWRSNAQRQREKGVEFVIGRRDGPYLWDLEGTRKIIDCGTAGGVHSLGHRNRAVLGALQGALTAGHDTGLWSLPNKEQLRLQESLAALAPTPKLNRSIITLASTVSVDLAIMFSFRVTGRRRILVYRHGYHGHTGFAALATGSSEEGVRDYYNLPDEHATYFERYGQIESVREVLTSDIAAIMLEPVDYETFAPASPAFLREVESECRSVGALFILDETRTGLGRSGRLWAAEHFAISPDMLISGKGLTGGLYPVSALMTSQDIYDQCMNSHKFPYISSLGGNEISCIVADEVLVQSNRPELLAQVNRTSDLFRRRFAELVERYDGILGSGGTVFGLMATLEVLDQRDAAELYRAVFEAGVLCHSISCISPFMLKFLPPLTIGEDVVDEIVEALNDALERLSERKAGANI